ncbi:hypothetical protein HYU40_00950 [Candidatus Woesearchaeota archaeon]|nr:hypothetical protein [Candidatus Woesearchaeota archaeon]
MGLRREKEVTRGSSVRHGHSGESGMAYRVFTDEALSDYEQPQNDMKLRQLTAQLAQKTSELERLRDYVTKLEEGENGLMQELTRQLATKDEEVSRIAALYAKKEAENKKLSTAFEAHIISEKENAERIKSLLLRKEQDTAGQTERLRKEIERKDAEIASLRNSLIQSRRVSVAELPDNPAHLNQIEHLQKRLEDKESETSKLQRTLLEEQKLSRATQSKLKEQLSETAGQVEELKILLIDKQKLVQQLQAEFEKSSPKTATAEAEKPGHSHKAPDALKAELDRKNAEIMRLQKGILEEQNINKSIQSRLKEQLASTTSQMEELKSFLIEKEKLVQNLEAAFEKRITAKEEEIRHLRTAVEHKPATGLHKEIDRLKSELQIKEEASAMMAEEMAKIKEQSALIRRRLEERQRIFFESERAYEELIGKLREQHDARAKALIQEASQKETTLSAALKEERAKMRKETALMKEKEKQIAETLQAFSRTSEQLIKLGSAGQPGEVSIELEVEAMHGRQKQIEERAKYLEDKENELKTLLSSTEARIAELKAKEAEVERKEQLLLQEQEGLNKELDVLANAGIEIGKSRQYLQQKLQQISTPPLQQSQPQFTEQPFQQQPTKQPIQQLKQQPSPQFSFGSQQGVQEAQEEEQFETPKFTGISSAPTQVQEAVTELSDEEGFAGAPKAPATIKAAIIPKPEAKAPKLTKLQQKKLANKLKAEAKAAKAKEKQQLQAKKPQVQQLQQKETAIGAREAEGRMDQELFTEMGGYSEVDEIKSIVEVGLQHGDSIEQIRESLLVSGYSKQNIEKALGGVKK